MKLLPALGSLLRTVAATCLGYLLVRPLGVHADMRGGFLLLSPLVALYIVGLFGPFRGWFRAPTDTKRPDPEVEAKVRDLASRLAVPVPEVVSVVSEPGEWLEGVVFREDQLCFYPESWSALDPSDRDFILASRLAGHYLLDKKLRNYPLEFLIYTLASAIACLNLWLILALQSGGGLSFAWWSYRYNIRRTLEQDVLAVRATGDLAAAKAYILRKPRVDADLLRRRIANLDAVFGS
ncbi:MAG TPA: hypothetical protein VMI31_09085 [Fimbriimonadaceae bacterium]|nr:hypothetical protein [Fimbriimonadaceae bacterium]